MRRYYLILLFLFVAQFTLGQKMAEDYFTEAGGDEMYGESDSTQIRSYLQLVELHPTSKFCSTAYYRIGTFYEKNGQDRLAINAYRAAFFDRHARPFMRDEYYSEGDAKPKAISQLIQLYEKTGNYDSALYFFYIKDTALKVFHSCGTGLEVEERYAMIWASDIHLKINQVKKAEEILLHLLIFKKQNYDNEYDWGSDTTIARLKNVFRKYENTDSLKTQIDVAINNYFVDTVYSQSNSYRDTLVACYINFLGCKVGYHYRYMISGEPSWNVGTPIPALLKKEEMIALLKTSELYKLIKGL